MTIRIVIADDHPIFRDGLARSLEDRDGLVVAGVAETADEAVLQVERLKPDIALLDISMPGNGIEAAARIAKLGTGCRVVMLTVSEDEDNLMRAVRAGACAYVLKGVSAMSLRQILKGVAAGQSHFPSSLARKESATEAGAYEGHAGLDRLTERETQILRCVAGGLSNREVADELALQEKTVKHYMTSILAKLGLRNRVEAALLARDAWHR